MSEEFTFDFQKEKFLFTKLFNSSVKRSIIGLFFRLQKEFVTNTNWDPEFYNRLSFTGGKSGKLKRKNLEFLIHEPKAKESLQFLIDFKLLLPLPVPEDLSSPLPDINTLIEDKEEYHIISGIEFDEDIFSTLSSGLKITVEAIHHLIHTTFNFKVMQNKLQSSLDEMLSLPSRTDPNRMIVILEKSDKLTKSTAKKKIFYRMTDVCYKILNEYHPLDSNLDLNRNGSVFINLLNKSISISQIVSKTAVIGNQSKKLLKALDSQFILKNTTLLVDKIILRELFISNYENFFDDEDRLSSFIEK